MKNITIIGSGSFGCALAYLLQQKNNVKIWSYTDEETNSINVDHKCLFLPEIKLDEKVKCYKDYAEAIEGSDIILLATPSSVFTRTCESIKDYIINQDIVIATKGMDKDRLLSEVAKEIFNKEVSIISGPSHAEQIGKNIPTYVDFCGKSELTEVFETDNFKVNEIDDEIGIQVGASLKNVISLAAGIVEGLGYESNTNSYVVVEGLKEIKDIGVKMGAKESTFYGLSGLGDLLTTTQSLDSRNKRAGLLLAKNYTLDEVKKEIGMTIEGLDSLSSAYLLMNKYNLDCKIIKNLYDIIYNNKEINSIL